MICNGFFCTWGSQAEWYLFWDVCRGGGMWEWYGLIVSNCGLGVFVGGLGWYGNHEDPEWKLMPRSLWRIGDFFMCNQPMKLPAGSQLLSGVAGSGSVYARDFEDFWRLPVVANTNKFKIVKIHAVPNDGTRDGCVITAWISIRMLKGIGKPYPRRSQAWASTPCCFTGNGQIRGRPWNETGERVALVQQLLERPQGCKGCNLAKKQKNLRDLQIVAAEVSISK